MHNFVTDFFSQLSMKRVFITLFLFTLFSSVFAYDFVVDGIKYNQINSNTVRVTSNRYSGDVVIPEQIEYEGYYYTVTSIGQSAFSGCGGLISVIIPNSVTSIGKEAFNGCSGLKSITIGNSVTSIGSSAFNGCSGLTSVTILCRNVGSWFSGLKSIKEVVLGEKVTSIGDKAFYGCSGLTSVTIPNSVTSLGNSAFYGCSGLTSINIPDGVTNISYQTFYNCSGLTSVTIPNSVTSIGNSAFYGCRGLTSVTIPSSVTSIGQYTFRGCSGLTSVISLNTTPPQIYNNTFSEETYQTATLNVPLGYQPIYWLHPYWENFAKIEEIEVTAISPLDIEENKHQDGFIYNLQGKRMRAKTDELYKLPRGIYIINGKKHFVK